MELLDLDPYLQYTFIVVFGGFIISLLNTIELIKQGGVRSSASIDLIKGAHDTLE